MLPLVCYCYFLLLLLLSLLSTIVIIIIVLQHIAIILYNNILCTLFDIMQIMIQLDLNLVQLE